MQYASQENNNIITEVDSDKGDESMTPVTPRGFNNQGKTTPFDKSHKSNIESTSDQATQL